MKLSKATRNEFASKSTTNNYYATKGEAVAAFNEVLEAEGVRLSAMDTTQLHGDEGRVLADVVTVDPTTGDELNQAVARAVVTWYRMPSGRYEFVGYLA
jgi:hypothetical protein